MGRNRGERCGGYEANFAAPRLAMDNEHWKLERDAQFARRLGEENPVFHTP